MSNDTITVTGLVATTPRLITTGEGLTISSFRLASTQRRFDKDTEKWIDGETNWFTVTCFRQLAANAARCLNKGERVIVMGGVRIREWDNGERGGTTVEIEADAVGHDLTWGTTVFARTTAATTEAGSVSVDDPTA